MSSHFFVSDEVPSAAMPPQAQQLEPRRVRVEQTHSNDFVKSYGRYSIIICSTRFVGACVTSSKSSTRLMMEDKVPLWAYAVPHLFGGALSSPQFSNTLQQQPAATASCCSSSLLWPQLVTMYACWDSSRRGCADLLVRFASLFSLAAAPPKMPARLPPLLL